MHWIFFALLAYAVWDLGHILDKILVSKEHIKHSLGVIIIINFAYLFMFLIIPFVDFQIPTFPHLILVLLAGCLMFLCFIPYYKAITIGDISRISPLWQLSPIFVLILSTLFLGERLFFLQYIGFIVLILGGYLISIKKLEGFKLNKAFYLMILAGIIGSFYAVIVKYLMGFYNTWTLVLWVRIGTFFAVGAILLVKKYRIMVIETFHSLKHEYDYVLIGLNVVFGLIGMISMYYAMSQTQVSLASVLGGFSPLFILIYASIISIKFPHLFKEEMGKKVIIYKFIAIFLMLIGLILIYR